jgi:putative FmdB family regulatory protein
MPLYEYRCVACGRQFEQLQSSARTPAPGCPACGKETEKLLSAPGGFQIKELRASRALRKPKSLLWMRRMTEKVALQAGGYSE